MAGGAEVHVGARGHHELTAREAGHVLRGVRVVAARALDRAGAHAAAVDLERGGNRRGETGVVVVGGGGVRDADRVVGREVRASERQVPGEELGGVAAEVRQLLVGQVGRRDGLRAVMAGQTQARGDARVAGLLAAEDRRVHRVGLGEVLVTCPERSLERGVCRVVRHVAVRALGATAVGRGEIVAGTRNGSRGGVRHEGERSGDEDLLHLFHPFGDRAPCTDGLAGCNRHALGRRPNPATSRAALDLGWGRSRTLRVLPPSHPVISGDRQPAAAAKTWTAAAGCHRALARRTRSGPPRPPPSC